MRLRAAVAELRVGHRRAALLEDLRLERDADRQNGGAWTATARVRERDAFWSAHGGAAVDLVAPVGGVRWVWRGVRVAWGEDTVGVSGTGAPEVR